MQVLEIDRDVGADGQMLICLFGVTEHGHRCGCKSFFARVCNVFHHIMFIHDGP